MESIDLYTLISLGNAYLIDKWKLEIYVYKCIIGTLMMKM